MEVQDVLGLLGLHQAGEDSDELSPGLVLPFSPMRGWHETPLSPSWRLRLLLNDVLESFVHVFFLLTERHFHEDQNLIHPDFSRMALPIVDTLPILMEWVRKLNVSLLAK